MIENELRGLATSRHNRVFLRTQYIVHSTSVYLYECRFQKRGHGTLHFKQWGYAYPSYPLKLRLSEDTSGVLDVVHRTAEFSQ